MHDDRCNRKTHEQLSDEQRGCNEGYGPSKEAEQASHPGREEARGRGLLWSSQQAGRQATGCLPSDASPIPIVRFRQLTAPPLRRRLPAAAIAAARAALAVLLLLLLCRGVVDHDAACCASDFWVRDAADLLAKLCKIAASQLQQGGGGVEVVVGGGWR